MASLLVFSETPLAPQITQPREWEVCIFLRFRPSAAYEMLRSREKWRSRFWYCRIAAFEVGMAFRKIDANFLCGKSFPLAASGCTQRPTDGNGNWWGLTLTPPPPSTSFTRFCVKILALALEFIFLEVFQRDLGSFLKSQIELRHFGVLGNTSNIR